jgi:phosphatidylglycerol:prolipoprotein diacylglycerol transferase
MLPAILVVHDLRVSTWGLLVTLAALSVLWLGRADAPAKGLPPDLIERLWPGLLLGGFVGAHAYYMIAVGGWPLHHYPLADILNIFAGTAVQGGLLGGAAAAMMLMRWKKLPLLPLCDALSPAGALAQAITRVGCFAAGCCYGRPTNSFLGVAFSRPGADPTLPLGVHLHPAQLYEAFLDAGLALVLQRQVARPDRPGALFARYLMGSSLVRFGVEFFRGDDAGRLVAGLAHSQFTSLALFAAAASFYWVRIAPRRALIFDVRRQP